MGKSPHFAMISIMAAGAQSFSDSGTMLLKGAAGDDDISGNGGTVIKVGGAQTAGGGGY